MTKIRLFFNFLKTKKGVAVSLVFFAIVFNTVLLWPEIAIPTLSLNDEVLHLTASQEASSVLKQGRDPTDFWLPQIGLGYPLFHHYQHLPHTVLAIINQFTHSFLSLPRLLDFSRYFLLVLYPLSIFWAMHRFGFSHLAGGFAALVASLLSTEALYGLDYGSYIWRGSGLYTQLWAMFFLPLALAELYHAITKKNHLFWAVFLSAVVLLSNLIYGYILFLSAVLFVFLQPKKEKILFRLKRLALIVFLVGLVTSYFLVPFFLNRAYLSRSILVASFKYDSFGIFKVLGDLFSGALFDYGRFPTLTIFFFLGTALIVSRRSKENYCFLLWLTVFWLFLYFGRSTWGVFLNILPFSRFLQFHRFIGGFHLAAVMTMGAGGALVFERVRKISFRLVIFLILIFGAILLSVYIERIKFYGQNSKWRLENQQAFSIAEEELSEIKQTLKDLSPGRVYAGLPATWGSYPYYQVKFVPFYAIFPQWGVDSFGYAYHAEALAGDVRLHFDDTKLEQYNLFNIRYVLLHQTWTPAYYYSKVKEFKNYVLYEVPTTGYFDLVDVPAVFYGRTSDFYYPNFKWLSSSLPELKQHPLLEIGDTPEKTFGLPVFSFQKVDAKILDGFSRVQPERGKILNEKLGVNQYQVQFEAKRDCYLVLKTNYHPGWQVYLDHKEVSALMLAPGFVGIKVQPGTHEALFVYRPPVYRFPLLVFGIFILSIMFFDYRKPFIAKRFKKPLLRLNNLGKRLKINYLKTFIKKGGKPGDDVEKIDSQRL